MYSLVYHFYSVLICHLIQQGRNPRGNGFNAGRPNEYGGWTGRPNDMGNKMEFSYAVPSNKCGIIIGKGKNIIYSLYFS